MGFSNFKLIKKEKITKDVFELVFESEKDFEITPGQFITFMLPKSRLGRSYSVLSKDINGVSFLIKRLEDGRGGSKEICDLNEGEIIKGIGPAGKFIDSKKDINKLYIATGTGVVPLFFMIGDLLKSGFKKNIKLVLGNRTLKDLYYIEKLKEFKKNYSNFDYEIFLSREDNTIYNFGYVKNYVKDNYLDYDEFYICGNPNMIDEVIEILINSSISKENIFEEKY
ncbi:FAD-dependent oxidoreductase [Candidatus Gracilibacteria bacterium]|nr:FAD-dependent oxidoreductase [Candidatus Gracilibacteria bacterium]